MSWRDRVGPASFRGVSFHVLTAERTAGRQAVVHEVPQATKPPYTEDLGLAGRAFRVEAYVIGADYEDRRNSLLTAIEAEGPGELVHPAYGVRRVVVLGCTVREEQANGGQAVFSIEFAETSTPETALSPDVRGALDAAATSVTVVTEIQFTGVFGAVGGALASASTALRAVGDAVGMALGAVTLAEQTAADLQRQVTALTDQAEEIAAAPGELHDSVTKLVEDIRTGLEEAAEEVAELSPSTEMLKLLGIDLGSRPTGSTAARVQEAANYDAIQALVERTVLVQAARAAVAETFTTLEDAQRVAAALTDAIDAHVETATDDTFSALMDLRTAIVNAVPDPMQDLPRVQHVTPISSVPSLVLAYQTYGSTAREAEIVARNRIIHPAFMRAGEPVAVLTVRDE